ncbi:MAG: homoserine dehydrogenase [Candidatus Omnitrophica bacterium]|nr:homoserine dehydrogenase [Candidatus Omnitrophota bacterium]
MRTVNIGIIGFGTIGSGVVEALLKKRGSIKAKTGVDLKLKMICDKDLTSKRPVSVSKKLLSKNINKVLNDPEVDIIVELIGGIHPAKEIIKKALKNGKDVVTANKALLCENGKELFDYAARQGRSIRFEGSVGGGIPIIKALKESLVANDIQAIYGIVNGTSNYVLRSMEVDRYDFKRALSNAKRMGVAERNATLDVNGTDSAHKLALLASLGFGNAVSLNDIYVEGITKIQPYDIEYAGDLGYCIKLLAIAKRFKDELELRVHPTLVRADHPVASVRGVNNAIFIKGDLAGESLFYGRGAGRYPTSSAVVSDIVDLAKCAVGCERVCGDIFNFSSGIKKIRSIEEIISRYYIRLQAIDMPGVLAAISNILARHRISIASVKQVERKSQRIVPIVMLTHDANESSLRAALKRIDKLSCIKANTVAIKIERL